jgi:DNA gyrase/topoisomerase IV subunit A
MSTILDSLKKSSDQRNSDKNNSINNFNFGSSKKASSKRYLFIFLFLLAFAFGFYYFMQQYYLESENASNQTETENPINLKPNKKQRTIEGQELQESEKPNNKLIKPNVAEVKQELKQLGEQKAELENQQAQDAETNILNKNELQATHETDSSDTNIIKSSRDTIRRDDSEIKTVKTNKDDKVSELQQRIKNLDQGVIKEVDPSEYEVQQQEYQYVHQLPFSIRKELPKFKLNVHIFDKLPENRVAIINGVRFNIGDMIEETVQVKDIIQDGVLLDFNGEVFLIPR